MEAHPTFYEETIALIHTKPLLPKKTKTIDIMNKPSRVILPLAVLLSTAPSLLGQYFSGNGSASASVTPGDPSSSSVFTSFPTGLDDGSLPGSTSGSASFTANGVSAVGSASGTYAVSSGWNNISVSTTAAFNYPATPPNSELGNLFGYGALGSADGYGYITIYDVVFSGPSVATLGSFNLSFSGSNEASGGGTAQDGNIYGQSSFNVSLSGATPSSGHFSGNIWKYADGIPVDGGDLLAGYTGGTVDLSTGQWVIPTGVPLTLQIDLSGYSSGFGRYDSNGEASSEANVWLSLNTPLFNLPEGFTVNSADGAIVDNFYTAVPEPEHYFALAGAGLALFGLYRRARRTRSA